VRVSVQIPNAGEEALGICGPGEFVGEMALVDLATRSADLTAHDGPCSVFVLSRDVFRRLLNEPPLGSAPLLAGIGMALSLRLESAIERSVSFYVMSGGYGAGPQELPPELPEEDDPNAIDLLGTADEVDEL
jgi:CRP-like cAMP-binding protein